MNVYRVDFADLHMRRNRKFVMLECEHPTLSDVLDALQTRGVIHGFALWTRPGDAKGEFEVVNREEMVIGLEAVATVTVPPYRYFEYED